MMESLQGVHHENPDSTVPVYLCSDMTHGVADRNGSVLHDCLELFAHQAPYMAEFHFKNTDARFDATFGFDSGTASSGIIDLAEVRELIADRRDQFPVARLAGYLELPGPKRGREYSDILLEDQLRNSIRAIQKSFADVLVSP
jgi:ribulose-phosphate 3-epimerase